MTDQPLATLSDRVTEAHARIQRDFSNINPVVSVRRNMRNGGVPADALTIDSISNGKRILLILHDQHPGMVIYQLSLLDKDTDEDYERLPLAELTTETLYQWMKKYFSCEA